MSQSFSAEFYGPVMARHFDLLHRHRDYPAECAFVDRINRQCNGGTRRVLDLACGTGEHALGFARMGYEVTGVDSSPAMLEIARAKSELERLPVVFRQADIAALDAFQPQPCICLLGYTFLYLKCHEAIAAFLAAVHRSLLPSGVFIFDTLEAWSLIDEFPRDKSMHGDERVRIWRFCQASLDRPRRLRRIESFFVIEEENQPAQTAYTEESLRITFADELLLLLRGAGFADVQLFRGYGDPRPVGNPRPNDEDREQGSTLVIVARRA